MQRLLLLVFLGIAMAVPQPIALFCTDINLGGQCITMDITNVGNTSFWGTLPAPWSLAISSLQVVDLDYMVTISAPYGAWNFRSPIAVNNFFSYPAFFNTNWNDYATGVSATYRGPFVPGATLYANENYAGQSIYVETTDAPNINTAAYQGYGVFPNDALSSMIVLQGTNATIYANYNYVAPAKSVSNNPSNPPYLVAKMSDIGFANDAASSIKLVAYP